MKSLTFNKNSWHFLLATKLANYHVPYTEIYTLSDGSVETYMYGDPGDICTYSKHVLGGLLLMIIAGAATGVIGFALWHLIFGIYFSLMLGTWFFSDWGNAILIAILIVGGIICFSLAIVTSYNLTQKIIRKQKESTKPDGFVKHAYNSWKSKFCVPINFVDSK